MLRSDSCNCKQLCTGHELGCPRRDIKPANLVLERGRAGGRVYLVDFGGVQAVAAADGDDSQLGSTIVGTYGCIPSAGSPNSPLLTHLWLLP